MPISDITTRQKITIGVFALVLVFLLWQVKGLFQGGQTSAKMANANNAANMSQMPAPRPAPLPKPAPMTEREAALFKWQQQTEEKYITASNELQMLKITRDIAETNKAIATAKLDTVTAQKNTLDLLSKPAATLGTYAEGLANPLPTTPANQPTPSAPVAVISTEVNYVVISVTQLQGRWGAVLGYQGKLFNASIGDNLPADGSKVLWIDKSGVTLEKAGIKKKVSLVPVI